jgi:hypothetical protein
MKKTFIIEVMEEYALKENYVSMKKDSTQSKYSYKQSLVSQTAYAVIANCRYRIASRNCLSMFHVECVNLIEIYDIKLMQLIRVYTVSS